MVWIALIVIILGYFIFQAIQQNTKTRALTSYTETINSPAYIKKETEGKRLYVKRVFKIAENDLKTRDRVTQRGIDFFEIVPKKSSYSYRLTLVNEVTNYQKEYKKVMDEKNQVYDNSIKELDSDPFFLKYDFIKNGENPYTENFFDLDGNEDLRKKYNELTNYTEEITNRYNELQDKIKIN